MKKDLKAAIRVAAQYAAHLHRDDRVSKRRAIRSGVRAVLRAARKG